MNLQLTNTYFTQQQLHQSHHFFLGLFGEWDNNEMTIKMIHTLQSWFYILCTPLLLTAQCAAVLLHPYQESC